MAAGEVAEGTVEIDGKIYPVLGKVNHVHLGVFERKITIGDATKDSDDFISSWIISDLSGGLGVEHFTASDTARYGLQGEIDGRTPGQIALPPLNTVRVPTADTVDITYPLGDVPGANSEFYVAVWEGAGVVRLYAWNEAGLAFRAFTSDIDYIPVNKPVVYQGTNANNRMFIPQGANGYATARTSGVGTTTITQAATPTALAFVEWDNRLWTVNASGVIYYSFDGTTWVSLTDPFTAGDLTLDPAKTVKHLISFYDTQGQSRLYIVTDKGVYLLDLDTPKIEATHLNFPPHPYAARAATVWRPGADLWVSLGGNQSIRYTPAGVAIGFSGPGADRDGLASILNGNIIDFIPEFYNLYCIIQHTTNAYLFAYSGVGWHCISHVAGTATWGVISTASSAYRLWWGIGPYAWTIVLPTVPLTPRQTMNNETGSFAPVGHFRSPRFDAGMMGFDKLAVRATVIGENMSTTETIEVQYSTDAGGLTSLGTITASGKKYLQFGTAVGGIYPGVPFNWMDLYVLFATASSTESPLLNALILHYVKIRQDTQAYTFTINLADKQYGRGGQAMHDEIDALIEATTAFSFKHRRETFRAWIAGVDVTEDTGNADANSITVSLIVIPTD